MKTNPKVFFGFGILFSLFAAFFFFIGIAAGEEPIPQSFIMISMAIMAFCLSYLQPHFKEKDERMKRIREKGMFYSYFALLVYYMVLSLGLQLDLMQMTAIMVVNLMIALTISTVFISMVIVAKTH
ncbi:permease [Thalassobacillus hwangdonensis]|uniref:Permease n=1 Tax=Thalassobacillus hwangdonensis TaxID=546108 RepID=A0ABW3KZU3_9BACI